MKLEILARRIAEKTSTPELEPAILERRLDLLTHDKCMVWAGRKSRAGVYPQMVRMGAEMRPEILAVQCFPHGTIQVAGKQVYVHRWVFAHLLQPGELFRLRNHCGNTLCVNPHHWKNGIQQELLSPIPETTDDWSLEEAQELVEIYLTTNETLDPEHPLLIDIPGPLLEEVLINLNKKHLLNP